MDIYKCRKIDKNPNIQCIVKCAKELQKKNELN